MAVDRSSENKRVQKLADELFRRVEKAQGFAFVSDGEGAGMTEQQFFERIRGRLEWSEKSVKIIRAFLIEYQPLRMTTRDRGAGKRKGE